ncbi:hypothetical protein ABNJ21_001665 [Klebsiella michiganensis]
MTTDITALAQSLKAAAEKSGIEQWVNNHGEVNTADYEVDGGVFIDHICDCEIIGTESPRAELIALANPANILALVEALEKEQTKAIEQGRTSCELFDEVTALRQRIAELESHAFTVEPFRSFVTDADLAALHRFAECCDDPESGGHDLEKEQVRRLEEIGALRRHGRVHWITDFGDVLISITAGIKWEAE